MNAFISRGQAPPLLLKREGLTQAGEQVADSCSLHRARLSLWLQSRPRCHPLRENASSWLRQVPPQSCQQRAICQQEGQGSPISPRCPQALSRLSS